MRTLKSVPIFLLKIKLLKIIYLRKSHYIVTPYYNLSKSDEKISIFKLERVTFVNPIIEIGSVYKIKSSGVAESESVRSW